MCELQPRIKIGWAICSKANAPSIYPNKPPATELTIVTAARKNARLGAAIIIGINMTSGGIGKTELSIKAINAKTKTAFGCFAKPIVQL